MVKSRAAMTKVSRTISVEENSSSQAGSVVLPDPVCGSRGAKSEQTNPRGCSLSRDSPVSKGKSSKARGGATPSPGAADGMHLSRDIIKGPLKELSKSELNTGIVHVGLSSRKAASVARPSTSAKARKSILEAQSYDWGDQDREAGSSPPANENILSVQHAVDLAQQAVEAFKTPPSKEFSTKWKQGSSGPSRSESARDGKRYSAKFSMQDVMTPGITGKLSHRMDALLDTVKQSERADCPMTPYVLSSCSCATSGAVMCSLHGPRASSVKSSTRRPRLSVKGATTPGFKGMHDFMSPVPESTSMLSMSQGCITSPDYSMQVTPPQQPATSSSSHASLKAEQTTTSSSSHAGFKAGMEKKCAKEHTTVVLRSRHVDQVEVPGVGEGHLLEEQQEQEQEQEQDALSEKKLERDIIVMVRAEWREDNGFQVWEVVERSESGEPLRGVELLPLTLLGSQCYGSFSFARTDSFPKRSLVTGKHACGNSVFQASADFREVDVTVGKRKYQVVKLTKEQKQVTKLHEELSKRPKAPRRALS